MSITVFQADSRQTKTFRRLGDKVEKTPSAGYGAGQLIPRDDVTGLAELKELIEGLDEKECLKLGVAGQDVVVHWSKRLSAAVGHPPDGGVVQLKGVLDWPDPAFVLLDLDGAWSGVDEAVQMLVEAIPELADVAMLAKPSSSMGVYLEGDDGAGGREHVGHAIVQYGRALRWRGQRGGRGRACVRPGGPGRPGWPDDQAVPGRRGGPVVDGWPGPGRGVRERSLGAPDAG
jgi:hypothetical protein